MHVRACILMIMCARVFECVRGAYVRKRSLVRVRACSLMIVCARVFECVCACKRYVNVFLRACTCVCT